MSHLITSVEELTPQRLTEILYRNHHLQEGDVSTIIERSTETTLVSMISYLDVIYSPNSQGGPEHLFLKLPKPETAPVDTKEICFYARHTARMNASPSVPCYDAAYDSGSGLSHLLLQDVSHTHATIPWPVSPRRLHAERTIDAFAELHCSFWNHDQLWTEFGGLPSDEIIDNPGNLDHQFAMFVDFMGDRLSQDRLKRFEQVFESWPVLFRARISDRRNLTLIHRDAHAWNVLLPRDPNSDRVYLIDWQTYQPWISAQDLAYHIALFWYPEQRKIMEEEVLRRYHSELLDGGVDGYDWTEFWNDYRLSVIRCLYVPAVHGANLETAWLWWPQLEKVMAAFEDLDCQELLSDS
jgi:hypothetical protein